MRGRCEAGGGGLLPLAVEVLLVPVLVDVPWNKEEAVEEEKATEGSASTGRRGQAIVKNIRVGYVLGWVSGQINKEKRLPDIATNL